MVLALLLREKVRLVSENPPDYYTAINFELRIGTYLVPDVYARREKKLIDMPSPATPRLV